jgi:hypothetical protein
MTRFYGFTGGGYNDAKDWAQPGVGSCIKPTERVKSFGFRLVRRMKLAQALAEVKP